MFALEFRARVRDGKIEIPEEYRDLILDEDGQTTVRVLVLNEGDEGRDYIDELLTNPISFSGALPLTREEIYQ